MTTVLLLRVITSFRKCWRYELGNVPLQENKVVSSEREASQLAVASPCPGSNWTFDSIHSANILNLTIRLFQGIIINFIALVSYVVDVVGATQDFCKVDIGIQEQQKLASREEMRLALAPTANPKSEANVTKYEHTWSHQLTKP
ncbi:hypothetical protein PAAG_02005 [Paracoccidioides lutzii Pb01]|uniref:Uncharacterized protein n=1 Tax=Paracoccidioides lutzii (strain ATCC MYA-826 / Pb01) TaxID=502779 RepID=C1GU10_PARBA|nr:hypothetical protein PAAG_02005 [Paracoccidioides lutzii Pb01]EEH39816.2 hypothetical protein PAAG_02005 [Paracoccidioides lutzii Pb01]